MDLINDVSREWLEADGLGGFASGTEQGHRTRRYHALLCSALRPPVERVVLVNGLEVWTERPGAVELLSTQVYEPGVVHPDGYKRITSFAADPWPRWTFALGDGTTIEHELFAGHGRAMVALRWSAKAANGKEIENLRLCVRPLLSGRDYHHLHTRNDEFKFEANVSGESVRWRPYPALPTIRAVSNGVYGHAPQWYNRFIYVEERRRGLDSVEDLASPGVFRFDLSDGDAVLLLSAGDGDVGSGPPALDRFESLRDHERRRREAFPTKLHRAADAYLVKRGDGKSIIAGYPWFSDWGRDTFISIRGLCHATGRLAEAREILLAWSAAVCEGMLPNRFSDDGPPEYNAVDASLWFVIAGGEFIRRCDAIRRGLLARVDRQAIEDAAEAILAGYAAGTRFGIRLDSDGLIAAGEPGTQLTWMDAKAGDWVVTPRIGKPVEVQALWLNALQMSRDFKKKWRETHDRGLASFVERFRHPDGHLYDVIDVNHEPGTASGEFRCNQILAVGGLPASVVPPDLAASVVAAVEERLWTPFGLRTLAPGEPGYLGHYGGSVKERDGAYHNGTVWPWLAGPFVEAWVRVRGGTPEAKAEARTRFLEPLLSRFDSLGVGHLPEIADGDAPHVPGGCPFQAWSVAEAARLALETLAETP